jgi:hypothetical protein
MPWAPKDALTHKKGLTPSQQKKWASIANSVLAQCEKDQGSDCEGKAIRIANSQVDKSLDTEALQLVLTATITKAIDSQRRLFGWASIAVMKNGSPLLDLQGDFIDIEDLEQGWYSYVKESGELNFQHRDGCSASLIEAIVFTPEKLEALGLAKDALPLGAWVGYELENDADYQRVKDAQFLMFSIEGEAVREMV